MVWKVPKIWEGETCWIIGGGTSVPYQFNVPEDIIKDVVEGKQEPVAYSPFFRAIHDKHVIGVNNAYLLGSWLDMLFFGDYNWFLPHKDKLLEWVGLKISCQPRFEAEVEHGVRYLKMDTVKVKGISDNPSRISWNGNSGAAAINLAVHLGVNKIILLGFDMYERQDGETHWHGSHRRYLPKVKKRRKGLYNDHLKCFPQIALDAKAKGIEIINASPDSRIEQFPKILVSELLK